MSDGPDYRDFQTIEWKLRGIGKIQKSSLVAKVKLLIVEIVYLLVHNNNSNVL